MNAGAKVPCAITRRRPNGGFDIEPSIGLIGRKRTGKDTAAAHLIEQYNYTRHAFADPLREGMAAVDAIVGERWVEETDETVPLRYTEAIELYGYEVAKDRFPEVRRLLQNYGVGLRDALGENVWVDALLRRLDATVGPVVVTDVRFPNEAEALHARGFTLVRLTRASVFDGDAHASEALTDTLPADFTFANDDTVDALVAFIDGVSMTPVHTR